MTTPYDNVTCAKICVATQPAIVFVRPFDTDTKAVDLATGRWGFGHVAVYGCELDEQEHPLVIDAAISFGVVRRRLIDMTRGAGHVFYLLPRRLGGEIYARVRARLGQKYHYGGLAGRAPGRDDCATCSGLVFDCLPEKMRVGVVPSHARHPSPNDLARALGIPRQEHERARP